jgi:NADPH-dependent 2,4-dienoyl-CoA reductase/sulfur reductase-like enzyme
MKRPIVIAGASLAGLSVARELRKLGFAGAIQLVDPDDDAPYRRPSLSKGIVTGKQQPDEIRMPWPDELELVRVDGTTMSGLNIGDRIAHGVGPDGVSVELPYSHVVIATGATARSAAFTGPSHDIVTIRNMAEGITARARVAAAQRIVIIGGGFIGLEVAAAARSIGKDVTVVEMAPIPLAHAVGAELGLHLAQIHAAHGVEILCGVGVSRILGDDKATGVVLDDGRTIQADLVVAAVGSAPNVGWLADAGLDISAGVICDRMCVPVGSDGSDGVATVLAAGDAASWLNPLYERQMRVEHWTNAIEQGTFAARHIMGVADEAGFSSAPYFWSEQFDVRIQSIGSAWGHDEVVILDRDAEKFIAAYGREGTLVAVGGVNTGAILPKYRPLIDARASLASVVP